MTKTLIQNDSIRIGRLMGILAFMTTCSLLWQNVLDIKATGVRVIFPGKGEQSVPDIAIRKPVFVFAHLPNNFDASTLRSMSLLTPAGHDWKRWKERGVLPAHYLPGYHELGFEGISEDEWLSRHVKNEFGGDPQPVATIDEFGFDFGGEVDEKSGRVLFRFKQQRPNVLLCPWQTPRPIKGTLVEAYRRVVDLVLLEAYVHSPKGYLVVAAMVDHMKRHGLLEKTVVVLGAGRPWAESQEELERQVRFVKWIAPQCAGIGVFPPQAQPTLIHFFDSLCLRWKEIPEDGRGLPSDVREIPNLLRRKYKGAVLLVSAEWTQPLGKEWLIYLRNLGRKEARKVRLTLRNRQEAGGDIVAEGFVERIPPQSEFITRLPVKSPLKGWPPILEAVAKNAQILNPSTWE